MAANPIIRLGSKRAHTETTVLGQLKKSQQNCATAFESRQITAKRFVGPRNLSDQLMWGVQVYARLIPSTWISRLNAPKATVAKLLVEEWGLLHKRITITSLCVSVRFEKAYCWCFEKNANFFLSYSLLSE
jgi:hypothetical protein